MNASQHLDLAEQLLGEAAGADGPGDTERALSLAMQCQGHALIALAIELGAPHTAAAGTETASA